MTTKMMPHSPASALVGADPGVKILRTIDDSSDASVSIFERLARDPSVDVDKFERFVQMHVEERARQAEQAFNVAMTAAQADMRPVVADADNPQTGSRYASYDALDSALRPIYTRHGFGLSFDTGDSPHELHVRVLCYATHRDGGKRTYRIDMPTDGKGARGGDVMTRTHATGSGTSYGQRYLLKLIFNVAIRRDRADDDGNRAGTASTTTTATPAATPKDFDAWWLQMRATADKGLTVLEAAWNAAPGTFKNYVIGHEAAAWKDMKGRAGTVKVPGSARRVS